MITAIGVSHHAANRKNKIPPQCLADFCGGLMVSTLPGETVENYAEGENGGARNAVLRL